MISKTTNKFSSEVRAAVRVVVLDHEGEHASRWAAVSSIAAEDRLHGADALHEVELGEGRARQWCARR